MKKNKIVLLTVLIVLAVYCGAVIFVTKPDSFAYEALFRNAENTVQVPSSEKAEADAKAERDAILAEVETIAKAKADDAVKQAVAISNENIDKAIAAEASKTDAKISEALEGVKQEAVNEALAKMEAELPNIEKELLDKYAPQIEAMIDQKIADAISAYQGITPVSDEEYGSIRTETRESAINGLLSQLQDQ